ncbi:MAG TPA: YCF48-related protein, partial [Bacteroidota bacterium]|nr:YCF48-related protein [Bacteroidota bacterium]
EPAELVGPVFSAGDGIIVAGAADPTQQPSIARSTDNGVTWLFVTNTILPSSFCADSAGNLYCTSSSSFGQNGVFRSTDRGVDWNSISSDLPALSLTSVACGPDGSLYVGSDRTGTSTGSVFRSTDDGAHWETALSNAGGMVTSIAAMPTGTLLVGTQGGGVYRSTDGGSDWTRADTGLTSLKVTSIVMSPSGDIITGSFDGIFRSSDGAASWSRTDSGTANRSINALARLGRNSLIAGTGATLYLSTDDGRTWKESAQGIAGTSCAVITCNRSGTVVVGTTVAGGTYRSTDGGRSWASAASGGLRNRVVHCVGSSTDGSLFAGITADTDGIALYRSTDQGSTWEPADIRMRGRSVLSFAAGPAGEVLVGGPSGDDGTGVYRSTDYGMTWQPLHTGLANVNFEALAIRRDGIIYAGSYGDVIVSVDSGATWRDVSDGLAYAPVKSLACDSSGGVYAAQNQFGAYLLSAGQWILLDNGLPGYDEGSVLCLAFDSANILYAGTGGHGVYSGGGRWMPLNAGLTDSVVAGLSIGPGNVLFAATGSSGVFKLVKDSATAIQLPQQGWPEEFRLEQNYPNPFNPTTSIRYTVEGVRSQGSGVSDVRLVVYDMLGREVAVLVNEREGPGNYEVSFDGRKLSSGVYLYRLTAGSSTAVRKMVLVK